MNLFKKALIAVLGLGLVVAPSVTRQAEEVNAASSDVWGMVGTMNGWSFSNITSAYETTYNSSTGNHELTIALEAKDEFKFILKGSGYSWSNKQCHARSGAGYVGTNDSDFGTYFSGTDNFVCKTSNTYKFSILSAASTYGDCEWGLSVEVASVTKYTVTYYDGAEKIGSEEVNEGAVLTGGTFVEKEGYRLEGWYTDSSLTTPLTGSEKVTSNTNVYAKYVEAEDYRVFVQDNGKFGSTVYAYTFASGDGRNNSWPGVKMTKDANGLWAFDIDASKSFDKIIFGNGKDNTDSGWAQTANLDLTYEDTLYTVGSKNTSNENKYDATLTSVAAGKAANLSVRYQENGTSLRLISTLGAAGDETFSLDSYTNVGFKFSNGTKEKEVVAGYVYTSVVANGEPISAAAYDAQYFFVTTFNNVPEGTSLTVTPYVTLANGFVYYGAPVTVTVSY